MTTFRIEKLTRHHAVDDFDCGQEALNRFLTRFALTNQQANASQTYVGLAGNEVIGFYTLVVSEITYDDAPERLKKGLARHPVPLMLLARLAVNNGWKGKGVGTGLLKDAMLRTMQAADIGGIRALAAHAKDSTARAFYEHFKFMPSPTDPLHLFILTKELQKIKSALRHSYTVDTLPEENFRAMSTAEVDPKYEHLNSLLDDEKSPEPE